MPVHEVNPNSTRPGYQWGTHGKVYRYPKGNEAARKRAKRKAILQGYVITQRWNEP